MSKKAPVKIHKSNFSEADDEGEGCFIEDFSSCEMEKLKIDVNYIGGQKRDIPEVRYWREIIEQAKKDLFWLPKQKTPKAAWAIERMREVKLIRRSAYNFLFGNAPSFLEYRRIVFENAGQVTDSFEMRELRKRADRFEAENS